MAKSSATRRKLAKGASAGAAAAANGDGYDAAVAASKVAKGHSYRTKPAQSKKKASQVSLDRQLGGFLFDASTQS